jgi:hypothetical protein
MREVVIPILNNEYKVVVCNGSLKDLSKTLKEYHFPEYDSQFVEDATENRRGVTIYHSRCYPVIWINRSCPAIDVVGTLAHEAVHAVTYIFEFIDEHSLDEVYAHSVGSIVRETLKVWKILKTKGKKCVK